MNHEGFDWTPVASALRKRANSKFEHAGITQEQMDDGELTLCLARILEGKQVSLAFGGPEEWDHSEIGNALRQVYGRPVEPAAGPAKAPPPAKAIEVIVDCKTTRLSLAMQAPEVPSWFDHVPAPGKPDPFLMDEAGSAWVLANALARLAQWRFAFADAVLVAGNK